MMDGMADATHGFDKDYWEEHWQDDGGHDREVPPHPYLATETADLEPGTALEAGCGEGAEALWLAERGWQVTAADISSAGLARAADRARGSAAGDRVSWVEADLSTWDPGRQFDLVTTHYAHPATTQLEFYRRLGSWVAPGGTLLVVGHLHEHDTGHGHHHPPEASVTAASVVASLDAEEWEVVTAAEPERTVNPGADHEVRLRDVVVRAVRRA
jgi:SAM-dependent methyltransferase